MRKLRVTTALGRMHKSVEDTEFDRYNHVFWLRFSAFPARALESLRFQRRRHFTTQENYTNARSTFAADA